MQPNHGSQTLSFVVGWCTLIEDLYEEILIVLTEELMPLKHGYSIDIDAVMFNSYPVSIKICLLLPSFFFKCHLVY
jgi:hypothetical protein